MACALCCLCFGGREKGAKGKGNEMRGGGRMKKRRRRKDRQRQEELLVQQSFAQISSAIDSPRSSINLANLFIYRLYYDVASWYCTPPVLPIHRRFFTADPLVRNLINDKRQPPFYIAQLTQTLRAINSGPYNPAAVFLHIFLLPI